MALKTENTIYADFKSLAETALTNFAVTGWEVKQLYQVIKTEDLTPSIYLTILRNDQNGAEYRKNTSTVETVYNKNYQGFDNSDFQPFNQQSFYDGKPLSFEERKYYKQYSCQHFVTIRFQATRRRLIADTKNTLNGSEVLLYINRYFQTLEGIKLLLSKGYVQLRGSKIEQQSFENDDENIQLMPYYDCDFIYTDSFNQEINKIENVINKAQKGF